MALVDFHPWRMSLLTLVVLMLLGTTGCGGKRLYPVTGQVVFKDGTPLPGGWIVFEPMDSAVKVGARGGIRPDGTFQLGTETNDDGALVGRYRVLVQPPLPLKRKEKAAAPVIHPRYLSKETTDLEYAVEAKKNHFRIEVERPEAPAKK